MIDPATGTLLVSSVANAAARTGAAPPRQRRGRRLRPGDRQVERVVLHPAWRPTTTTRRRCTSAPTAATWRCTRMHATDDAQPVARLPPPRGRAVWEPGAHVRPRRATRRTRTCTPAIDGRAACSTPSSAASAATRTSSCPATTARRGTTAAGCSTARAAIRPLRRRRRRPDPLHHHRAAPRRLRQRHLPRRHRPAASCVDPTARSSTPTSTDDAAAPPEQLTKVFADDPPGGRGPSTSRSTATASPYAVFSVAQPRRRHTATTTPVRRHRLARPPLADAGSALYDGRTATTPASSPCTRTTRAVCSSPPTSTPPPATPLISARDGRQHHELFEGVTADGGATWTWKPITADSTVDNIRRSCPSGTTTTPRCCGCAAPTPPTTTTTSTSSASSRPERPSPHRIVD